MKFEDYTLHITPLSEEDGGGYLASFPDLPGCVSDGETPEEALAEARDAFAAWSAAVLEDRAEQGKARLMLIDYRVGPYDPPEKIREEIEAIRKLGDEESVAAAVAELESWLAPEGSGIAAERLGLKKWDAADYLDTPGIQRDYVQGALDDGDPLYFCQTIGTVARARGLEKQAERLGFSEEKLKAGESDPTLTALWEMLEAIGIRLLVATKD